ncbi:MAG: hypothetical protein WC483_00345 [Candidatus Paceibacterota bacterium]
MTLFDDGAVEETSHVRQSVELDAVVPRHCDVRVKLSSIEGLVSRVAEVIFDRDDEVLLDLSHVRASARKEIPVPIEQAIRLVRHLRRGFSESLNLHLDQAWLTTGYLRNCLSSERSRVLSEKRRHNVLPSRKRRTRTSTTGEPSPALSKTSSSHSERRRPTLRQVGTRPPRLGSSVLRRR